jgi:transposase
LDVHKKTVVAAVLPPGSDRVTERVTIENHRKAVEKLVRRLAAQGPVEFVYEAGPCGYELQRQMATMGQRCAVIAPALTPVRPGDRVKTDGRDAEKLARYHRAGELTEIRIPSMEEEAARDLVRTREDILSDRLRAKHRLSKFLLRQGIVYSGTKSWGVNYKLWLQGLQFQWQPLQQTFEAYVRAVEEAESRRETVDQQLSDLAQKEPYQTQVKYLSCLKGIDMLTALTLAVEAQEFGRFEKARGFMSYTGVVPAENSSGQRVRRGSITKAGNAHIRRVLVEAAWSYRRPSAISAAVSKRREGCPPEVIRIAQKAQNRLHRKFVRMVSQNKPNQVTAVAVARELGGFVWSIARHFPAVAA